MNVVFHRRHHQCAGLKVYEARIAGTPIAGLREGDAGLRELEDMAGRRIFHQARNLVQDGHQTSMKVTLLISLSVVTPARAFSSADSRRNVIPSSRAARRISDAGRRLRISSRMRSERSSNSWMALRPRKPVPPHSKQPEPS